MDNGLIHIFHSIESKNLRHNSIIRNLKNEISRDLQDQEDGRYTQSLLGQTNFQSPSSNGNG